MVRRYKPIRRISSRQRLIRVCDKLLFEILKIKKGTECQVCGRPNPAPHHILEKGTHPRLRFLEANIILLCWHPCHFSLHHYTHDNIMYKRVSDGLKRVLGCGYRDRLLIANKTAPQLNLFQIELYKLAFRQELTDLGGHL